MKEGTCFNFYYLYGTVYPCIYIASITYMFVCVLVYVFSNLHINALRHSFFLFLKEKTKVWESQFTYIMYLLLTESEFEPLTLNHLEKL